MKPVGLRETLGSRLSFPNNETNSVLVMKL